MRLNLRSTGVGLFATICVLATSCAGNTLSGGGNSTSGGRTLHIGMSLTATGAPAYAALGYGLQAYLQYRNDTTAGVNGYKFDFNIVNNANTAQGGATSVPQLLSPKPDLLVVEGSNPFVGSLEVLKSQTADLPVVAFADADKVKGANLSNLFGTWPSYARECVVLAQYAIKVKKQTNLALLYLDNAIGQGASESCPASMKALGATKVTSIAIPPTSTTFTSIATQMKQAGVEGGIFIALSPQAKGVQAAAVGIGYKPSWYGFSSLLDQQYLALAGSAAEGTILDSWIEALNEDTPEVTLFKQQIAKYSPQSETALGAYGWTLGAVVAAGVEQATKGGKALTAASWMAALRQMKDAKLGLGPSLTYAGDQSSVVRQISMYQVEGTQFVKVSDLITIPTS